MKEQLETLVGLMVDRGIHFDEAVNEFEKKFIKRVLERFHGNQSRAARLLGIHRNTLSRKIDLYKLDHLYGLLLTFGLALIIEGLFRNQYGSSGQPYRIPPELVAGFRIT